MKLDIRQTRALYLAGTVRFPLCYSDSGEVWLDNCVLQFRGDSEKSNFVFLHEKSSLEYSVTRLVRLSNVSAIFFPGCWEERQGKRVFRFSDEVHDLERGEWFYGPDVNAEKIQEVLMTDIHNREAGAKGVVFVPESRAVFSQDEWTETAIHVNYVRGGCDPHR